MPSEDRKINPPQSPAQQWPPAPRIEEPMESAVLWRYMDLPKFIALLQWNALYFSQASQLGDSFEGSYPVGNAMEIIDGPNNRYKNARIKRRDFYYINCWHLNENESAAMWNLYTSQSNGVAIRTTYSQLIDSIDITTLVDPIYATKVKYIDYQRDSFEGPRVDSDGFTAFLYKHISFSHEHEFRLITTNKIYGKDDLIYFPPGIQIAVDTPKLIKDIIISPLAPSWFSDIVKAILVRYNYSPEIISPSSLSTRPIY